jgi:hypothetical protein
MGGVTQSPAYDEETEMLFDDWGATDGYMIPGKAP